MSRCRSCGAPILWAITGKASKPMPVDAEPSPDGNLVLTEDGAQSRAIVLDKIQLRFARERGEALHCSHFATCPEASDWRRKRDKGD